MAGNSFGQFFRITTAGESHGGGLAVIIDGCPPGIKITEAEIQKELDRRRPGQSAITTPRKEEDKIHLLSGITNNQTTGTPILLLAFNKDQRSQDYKELEKVFRPGHADYSYLQKYGIREVSGGGRSSARETLARVAAGVIAKKYLKQIANIEILSYVQQVQNLETQIPHDKVSSRKIEANILRCPDKKVAEEMIDLINKTKRQGDSLGGVIKCLIRNVPAGLGEPVFDKLHADLGKAMLSINAVKGFEIGSGFAGTKLSGSEHNDAFTVKNKKIQTTSNHAGGVLGGISNGEEIYFRVAFKPTSTIAKEQETVTTKGKKTKLSAKGRHDPCVLPRAVPIVDAMAAITLMDHYLRQKSIK